MDQDLLRPTYESEKRRHKKKRLVQAPNSYYMDIRCPSCKAINTIFSHARGMINCVKCQYQLGKSTGGKLRLTIGAQFKVKE